MVPYPLEIPRMIWAEESGGWFRSVQLLLRSTPVLNCQEAECGNLCTSLTQVIQAICTYRSGVPGPLRQEVTTVEGTHVRPVLGYSVESCGVESPFLLQPQCSQILLPSDNNVLCSWMCFCKGEKWGMRDYVLQNKALTVGTRAEQWYYFLPPFHKNVQEFKTYPVLQQHKAETFWQFSWK